MNTSQLKKVDKARQEVLRLTDLIKEEMESFESDYLPMEFYTRLNEDLTVCVNELRLQLHGLKLLTKKN